MMKQAKTFWQWILHHKKTSIAIFIVFLVIVFFLRPRPSKPVPTIIVKPAQLVQSISVSGSVNAKKFASLTFLAPGQLVYLGAQKGNTVHAGQTIAALDQRTVQENLTIALRDYSEQRNTFDQTQDNNQNRTPDQALNDSMKRILQNNQYDLDKAIASVELQDLVRQQSFLVSPIDGILARTDATQIGVTVTTANTFTVVDPTSLVFDMDVDEADIGKVQEGQMVNVSLDAFPDRILHMPIVSIDFVSHTSSTGGNAYTVEVKMPQGNNYRVGLNGNGEIITAEKQHVLTVPIESITDANYVYVKHGKKFEKQKINIGLESDTDAEVLQGLSSGDVVATDPTLATK